MWAGFKSEAAYLGGLLRVLRAIRTVTSRPHHTLGDHLSDWAARYGDRPALLSERETLTFRQLEGRANAYARWAIAQGLNKGDAVALIMPNRPEYVAIWMGLARAGVASALVNTKLTGPSLVQSINAVAAKAVIVDAELAPCVASVRAALAADLAVWTFGEAPGATLRLDLALAEFPETPLSRAARPRLTLDDNALLIYTSGTTGLPKAARITHSRLLRIMIGFGAAVRGGPNDKTYMCLPLYHSNGGMIGLGLTLPYGGSCYIRDRFSASAFWSDIVRENCTLFVYIGELCRYLINSPPSPLDRAHHIRACLGNGLRPDIFDAFKTRFAIAEIQEFYAATEGNAVLMNFDSRSGSVGRIPIWASRRFPMRIVAFDHDANAPKRGADGRCIPCKVDEPGELISEIRNDPKLPAARFDGYADAEATEKKILRDVMKPGDSWFRTGDLMRRDRAGYFYFIDRVGDTFRWKGENVSTTEVAATLTQFAGVRAAVVYGVTAPRHDGRAGMAALVVESMAVFDLDGLRAFLAERLPAYARPLFLRFRSELEVTTTFKLRTIDLIAEGFDPQRVSDPVYFDDRVAGGYRRVDETLFSALHSGALRL